jgi:hypothetical protein
MAGKVGVGAARGKACETAPRLVGPNQLLSRSSAGFGREDRSKVGE